MNSFEKSIRQKNTKISFRTDEATLAKLKAFCRIENRTISSLIENVLMDHVLGLENLIFLQEDKRQSPRKECFLPVIILLHNETQKYSYNGVITNLSLSSIQILLKHHPSEQLLEHDFFALFSIPNMDNPMLVKCSHVRASFLHEECMIVARFVTIESNKLNAINKFLTVHDFTDMKKYRQTS